MAKYREAKYEPPGGKENTDITMGLGMFIGFFVGFIAGRVFFGKLGGLIGLFVVGAIGGFFGGVSGFLGVVVGIIGAIVGLGKAGPLPFPWPLGEIGWRIFMAGVGYIVGTIVATLILLAIYREELIEYIKREYSFLRIWRKRS